MTPEHIAEVQTSFEKVAPIADAAGRLFYQNLFEVDPSLRSLFKGDIDEQARKLMQTLAVVVRGMDNLEKVVPAIQALGLRHAGYGVLAQQYDSVGAALLKTLETGLGEAFTPSVREAWTEAYGLVASTMKDAASTAPGL